MLKGPISRTRKSERRYLNHKKSKTDDSCVFCKIKETGERIIEENDDFWVINNAFPYDMWDGTGVKDHLMIVPKRHIHSLSELSQSEKMQYIETVSSYEAAGYSVYSRSNDNATKSVPHQHTHFIKIDNTRKKFVLYVYKPHIMLYV